MDEQLEPPQAGRRAVGPWSDLALHTMGWRAFQDLCSQVCEVVLSRPVEIFREAQDGGQDAVFLIRPDGPDAPAIGTVQCKHSSDEGKALRASDITPELGHVRTLIADGLSDTYIFMTNMSVDAPVASAIRAQLQTLGVRKAHILGRHFIVRAVRESPRLRALVPQVYGLGDLTTILDERLREQSRLLIEDWAPRLRKYYPTKSHRRAVTAINDHGIVLLLGNPASGKSTIGAIISTIASDHPDNTVLLLNSPRDFDSGWNPNDPGRFFWIDDAFGPNVVREDFVRDWMATFPKVRAALKHGNRFLFTSRRHIYEAAKRQLGSRNLSEFINGNAVVDVGALSHDEKAQILYNHINYGDQTQSWKTSVKPYLDDVTAVDEFLPGIAERLGDPNFTKSLTISRTALIRFMEEPTEHLIDTINALDETLRAALVLVYVHRGAFRVDAADDGALEAVAELTGLASPRILECFAELKGSFLRTTSAGPSPVWSFAHPTISDALTTILREKPHMMAALLRGAPVETILASFVCEGAASIRDALTIPSNLNDTLVYRLNETKDELMGNWSLFSFLARRASDPVIERLVGLNPAILERRTWASDRIGDNPKLATHARVHRLGLLNDELREGAARALEAAALEEFDLSSMDSEELLALIPAERLVKLGLGLRTRRLPSIEEQIEQITDDADVNEDPETHFAKLVDALNRLEVMEIDVDGGTFIDDARARISSSIRRLEDRKAERDRDEEQDDSDWSYITSKSEMPKPAVPAASDQKTRSIFDDVDQ